MIELHLPSSRFLDQNNFGILRNSELKYRKNKKNKYQPSAIASYRKLLHKQHLGLSYNKSDTIKSSYEEPYSQNSNEISQSSLLITTNVLTFNGFFVPGKPSFFKLKLPSDYFKTSSVDAILRNSYRSLLNTCIFRNFVHHKQTLTIDATSSVAREVLKPPIQKLKGAEIPSIINL
ncbi:hypothetical protein BpHYR1_030799 [Brachionus plicatilis]|uniref:Uncharacterized protein n=1 Tax=Brachionus plicatilis TaxID=10195 RepID=A0A3M7PR42_BRAPC|nr:hypothetical protein BpHYR1_030799 [Brachionus plicatilis]